MPLKLVDFGVLIEPLSIAEKAIVRALAVHEGEPQTALVLGLGPIGMLAAMALKVRGYAVRVHSLEPADHPRVAILRLQDIPYEPVLKGSADIVIEAAGSTEAALSALQQMPPLGVMVVLGAPDGAGPVPFLRMIINNQTIVGSVNADGEAFRVGGRGSRKIRPPRAGRADHPHPFFRSGEESDGSADGGAKSRSRTLASELIFRARIVIRRNAFRRRS